MQKYLFCCFFVMLNQNRLNVYNYPILGGQLTYVNLTKKKFGSQKLLGRADYFSRSSIKYETGVFVA